MLYEFHFGIHENFGNLFISLYYKFAIRYNIQINVDFYYYSKQCVNRFIWDIKRFACANVDNMCECDDSTLIFILFFFFFILLFAQWLYIVIDIEIEFG